MLNKLYNIFFIIFILIIFSIEDPIPIKVTPLTGIINLKYDSRSKQFTFDIGCQVDKNISIIITYIAIKVKVKTLPSNSQEIDATCVISPVRISSSAQTAETKLKCEIDTSSNPSLNSNTNLFFSYPSGSDNPSQINGSDIAGLSFEKFEDISKHIEINDLTLSYLEEDYCKNGNFIFQMTSTENFENNNQLESTICIVALSNDESHKEARCVIPMNGVKMKCSVDVSEEKYEQGNTIIIKKQDLVSCENGQILEIKNDPSNTLTIKEECSKRNYNSYLFINNLILLLLLNMILF